MTQKEYSTEQVLALLNAAFTKKSITLKYANSGKIAAIELALRYYGKPEALEKFFIKKQKEWDYIIVRFESFGREDYLEITYQIRPPELDTFLQKVKFTGEYV